METIKYTIAGFFAGIFESGFEYPFDVIKTRTQTSNMSSVNCIKSILKNEGYLAFYYGYTARLCACAISGSLLFGTNEYFKSILHVKKGEISLNAGFLTGCVEAIVYTPIDLVKSRMQIKLYGNLTFKQNIKKIYYKEGLIGFYKGIFGITVLKEGIGNCFYFGTYELVSSKLKENKMNKWIASIIGGGCAGSMYWIILPIDTIKTLKQTESNIAPKNGNSLNIGLNIIRKFGIKRLYQGFGPVLIRAWPSNMSLFLGYEFMKDLFQID